MKFEPSNLSPTDTVAKSYGESAADEVQDTGPAMPLLVRSLPAQAALGAAVGGAVGYGKGASPLNYALGGAILVPALGAVHWWFTKPKAAKSNPTIPGFGAKAMPCLGIGAPSSQELSYLQNSIGGVSERVFGEKTKAAVAAFQKSKNIYADGIAGPQTWASLGLPGDPCGGGSVQVGTPPPGHGVLARATGATTESGKINWWFWAAMGLTGVVIWQNSPTLQQQLKRFKEGRKEPKRATVPIIPAAWQEKDEEPEQDLSFFAEDFDEPEPEPFMLEQKPLMLTQKPEDDPEPDFLEAEWEDVVPEALPAPEEPIALLPEPVDIPDLFEEPPEPVALAAKNRRPRKKKRKKK